MAQGRNTGGDRILEQLSDGLARSAQALVPWFRANMPEYYFRTHSAEEQIVHLQAILAARSLDRRQALVLKSPCGTRITAITPGGDLKVLLGVMEGLADQSIQTARLYSSHDRSLRLDTFLMGPQPLCDISGPRFAKALDLVRDYRLLEPGQRDEFAEFLASASGDYVEKFEPLRAARHFAACECLEESEEVLVQLDARAHPGQDRIVVAMREPPERGLLMLACKVLFREGVDLVRAYGDSFDRGAKGRVAVMSFYADRARSRLSPDGRRWARLKRQLELIKWFAFHGLEPLAEQGLELRQVQFFQAACEFAHQVLSPGNRELYPSQRIAAAVLGNSGPARNLLACFEDRFRPGGRRGLAGRVERLRRELEEIPDDLERSVLVTILDFIQAVLRTNYDRQGRCGLGFRLDPSVLPAEDGQERPFGLFYVHGPGSFAFHARFSDMARGGLRLVPTRGLVQFERESGRVLSEAVALARAQHLKNKDIPEGGAKAVIVLGPRAEADLALKATVDALLDLARPVPGSADYLGRDEILFLGPDERIEPRHIEWIVDRAARRGYPWPRAFMSSKPRTGINHKEYGVTSEGVAVFAEEALRAVGLDPRHRSFSLKMTGGPAGDVASNALRILFREFGEAVKVLSVSDGHGAALDPEGLDHAELLRLADAGANIAAFDPARLHGRDGQVVSAATDQGARLRDDAHNRMAADLFLPCGGRPGAMNARNWTRFLLPDGRPSCRVAVEAANLYFSPEAATGLEQAGVLLVPGPSANKTGVICSSYEVLAALALDEEEFLAIREPFVAEVLGILRRRARDEARLLFSEYRLNSGRRPASAISRDISLAINGLTDLVEALFIRDAESFAEDPELRALLLDYCPPVLARTYGERLLERLPRPHQAAILAASMASRLVYGEGLEWTARLLSLRDSREVVSAYLEQEERVRVLLQAVQGSSLPEREELAGIVAAYGKRLLTMKRLGLV